MYLRFNTAYLECELPDGVSHGGAEKCILFWDVAPCNLVGLGTIVTVESAVLPTQKMITACSYDSY